MAYCTEAQVQAEFKDLPITSTSAIKSANVTEYIAEADAALNAIIGTRYQVPVTTGAALTLCQMMSRGLVADRIAGILAVKTATEKINQDATKMSRKEIFQMAKDIAAGKVAFDGAVLVETGGGVASYVSSNVVERTFKRGEKQW